VGISAAQMKRVCVIVAALLTIFFNMACSRDSGPKVVGSWVNTTFPVQTLEISQSGETLIVELKNSQMPELNQKFAARFKDNVIYLEGKRTQLFYDPKTDHISGVFGIGKEEFKRR
jgi:hypothetical protein